MPTVHRSKVVLSASAIVVATALAVVAIVVAQSQLAFVPLVELENGDRIGLEHIRNLLQSHGIDVIERGSRFHSLLVHRWRLRSATEVLRADPQGQVISVGSG